jgi:kynurenine formamidase
MRAQIQYQKKYFWVDFAQPLDISIPLEAGEGQVNCFYAPLMETWPVVAGDFVGSTKEGGPLNFLNVKINPHGNGTHTECVGHIAKEPYSLNECLDQFHHITKVVSIYPEKMENGDRVITLDLIKDVFVKGEAPSIVIRTLPNHTDKRHRFYSGTNPPFVHHEAIKYLVDCGVEHLLIDLPSVDREEDGGELLSHRAFWRYPDEVRKKATISELIFVKSVIKDGLYLLNLQVAPFTIDVSPSKPTLYKLMTENVG